MNELNFIKSGSEYICHPEALPSECTIHAILKNPGVIDVYGNLPEMEQSHIATFDNHVTSNSVIFSLNLPAGLEITLKSSTEVVKAKWM